MLEKSRWLGLRPECESMDFRLLAGREGLLHSTANSDVRPSSLSTALAYPCHLQNGKTSSFIHKNNQKCHHQMWFSSLKKAKMRFSSPRTPLGSLQRSQLDYRGGRQGKEEKGKEGEGRKEGRVGEERRREEGRGSELLVKVWLRACTL